MITTQTIQNFVIQNDSHDPTTTEVTTDHGKSWMERLVRQSKKLSQLIASSWMTEKADYSDYSCEEEVELKIKKAIAIREIFLGLRVGNADSRQTAYKDLENLFLGKAKLKDSDCSDEVSDSDKILFGPIFSQAELDRYQFEISWNAFDGQLLEHPQVSLNQEDKNKIPFFTLVLPYPPKPTEFESAIRDDKNKKLFKDWLKEVDVDGTEIVTEPFPPIAYAPLTTC